MGSLQLFWPDLVDVRFAELYPVHGFEDPRAVLREDVGRQPIVGVIGIFDGLVETVHFEYGYDWPEYFILNYGRFLFHILNNSRFIEPALVRRHGFLATHNDFRTFFSSLLNKSDAGLSFLRGYHRPEVRIRVAWISKFEVFRHANERWNKLVLDLLVNIHPFRADTRLATIPEPCPDCTLQRPGKISIMPDNERSLTTQL